MIGNQKKEFVVLSRLCPGSWRERGTKNGWKIKFEIFNMRSAYQERPHRKSDGDWGEKEREVVVLLTSHLTDHTRPVTPTDIYPLSSGVYTLD